MARRIGLAQALINDPDLLILDEPTTGLDPIGTRQIKDLILKLAERGKTILLCSHLLADVEDVCDRIAILYGGKIQAEGKVKDLLLQTDKKQITTGAVSNETLKRIKQLIQDEHADYELTCPMEKLEVYFIKTVTTAQEQAQPTSGAVSTTQIGDFLVSTTSKENILDKLVSSSVSKENTPQAPTNEQVIPTEGSEPKPNQELLTRLTESAEPPQPRPVIRDEKVKTDFDELSRVEPVEPGTAEQEQTKKNILDQLTDPPRRNEQDEHKQQVEEDKSQTGEASDE